MDLTKSVVDVCSLFDVPVEGELGAIIGKKRDNEQNLKMELTRPEIAADYVELTGVSSLAVAIGTQHGIYKVEPKLDYERLIDIENQIEVPLVLHGASGLSDDELSKTIKNGISKINIATDLRIAYTNKIKEMLSENSNYSFDPKNYGSEAIKAVKDVVKQKILILGSNNRI